MVPSPFVLSGGPSEALPPLRFSPVLKHYTWGGRRLQSRLGRELPAGVTAESWEISGHRNGPTPVLEGPWAGLMLPTLLERMGAALVGRRNRRALDRGRFPVLVKLLDAAEWLSVQVHPADDWALEREDDQGKTEMWVVLDADEGAELIQGFRPGVDRAAFAAAIESGRAEACLHRVPVSAGDVFFLRPGTVHALGPGILLAEIQQSSDVTYRVYDWNRNQPDRPLHLEPALEVLDFGCIAPGPVAPRSVTAAGVTTELLASCPHFETHRLRLDSGASWRGDCDGETYEIWSVLDGAVDLETADGSQRVKAVEWVLLPASMGPFRLTTRRSSTLLRVLTPAAAR